MTSENMTDKQAVFDKLEKGRCLTALRSRRFTGLFQKCKVNGKRQI